MPAPAHQLRDDIALKNASLAYMNKLTDFIVFDVAPMVPVAQQKGPIINYGKEFLRLVENKRAYKGAFQLIDMEATRDAHFFIESYGLAERVYHEDVKMSPSVINAQVDAAEHVVHLNMIAFEYALASQLTNPSVITQTVELTTASDKWTHADSDPIGDIRTAVATVFAATGLVPNTLILGWEAYNSLVFNKQIRETYSSAVPISKKMLTSKLSALFGIEDILIGKSTYTAARRGASSEALSTPWGDNAIVTYIEKAPKQKSRSLAKTYVYAPNASDLAGRPRNTLPASSLRVGQYAGKTLGEQAIRSKVHSLVQAEMDMDMVIVDTAAAYLIENVN